MFPVRVQVWEEFRPFNCDSDDGMGEDGVNMFAVDCTSGYQCGFILRILGRRGIRERVRNNVNMFVNMVDRSRKVSIRFLCFHCGG